VVAVVAAMMGRVSAPITLIISIRVVAAAVILVSQVMPLVTLVKAISRSCTCHRFSFMLVPPLAP
jgi:hypothetical protein